MTFNRTRTEDRADAVGTVDDQDGTLAATDDGRDTAATDRRDGQAAGGRADGRTTVPQRPTTAPDPAATADNDGDDDADKGVIVAGAAPNAGAQSRATPSSAASPTAASSTADGVDRGATAEDVTADTASGTQSGAVSGRTSGTAVGTDARGGTDRHTDADRRTGTDAAARTGAYGTRTDGTRTDGTRTDGTGADGTRTDARPATGKSKGDETVRDGDLMAPRTGSGMSQNPAAAGMHRPLTPTTASAGARPRTAPSDGTDKGTDNGSAVARSDSAAAGDPDQLNRRMERALGGFVDDPRRAVREADAVLDEAVRRLTRVIEERRDSLRGSWHDDNGDKTGTEELRVALTRYRDLTHELLNVG
ncbi:hypothetical protein [Actinacidiphila sp. ITFR-21]|uniref:hypothetical protein n=1 Tax=Actinacidiphila sp. ITFR-21 TaxID=3075199 RepID=UPI00288BFB88|nr:hypothetical protein [Streptomyces sp. ITFR-21]WNI15336.1 hypothetical protein RLT57_07195 [Streptomyces sp. ITFR-21]